MVVYSTIAATLLAVFWLAQYAFHCVSSGFGVHRHAILALSVVVVAAIWPLFLTVGIGVHVWCAYIRDRLPRRRRRKGADA